MAIPVAANTELIEEQYRRLERILYELYLVLRALMEPQVQPSPVSNNQQPPRGGSGGGSRRNRRRHPSARGRRSSPNGPSSCQQNGPQNPPPPPPPTSGSQSASTLLLNLANRANMGHHILLQQHQTPSSACTKSVETSVEWGKVGYDLRNIADSINGGKCQSLSSSPSKSSSTSSSSGSTMKLVTLALSLMLSRNWSSD